VPTEVVTVPVIGKATGWARESVHPLEWPVPSDADQFHPTATVELSYDGGVTWAVDGDGPVAEGYTRWTVPALGPSNAKLSIVLHKYDALGVEILRRRIPLLDANFVPSQKAKYAWQRVADNAPFGPRDGAGGLVFNGKMWLIGGWNGDVFPLVSANDVWSSVDGATWTKEKPNTFVDPVTFDRTRDWEGRHFAGYQVFGGKMWIIGGDVVQGYYQTDVWSSTDGKVWTRRDIHTVTPRKDPSGFEYPADVWPPVEESQFGLRALHMTGVFGGKLYLMGGQRIEQFVDPVWPGKPGKALNDVWTSVDGASWTQVQTQGPMWAPRGFVSEVVELGGRMWLIGGGTHDDPTAGRPDREYFNDVWSTTDGVHWEQMPYKPPFSGRLWHNVKAFDGRLWVINGYDGHIPGAGRVADNTSDVWYSVDGSNWYSAQPPGTFVPRHAGTVWLHDGALFVGSGNAFTTDPAAPDGPGKWVAEVWKMAVAR
jgi:hypothetical protein